MFYITLPSVEFCDLFSINIKTHDPEAGLGELHCKGQTYITKTNNTK